MSKPIIELICDRAALLEGKATNVHVLVRITAPAAATSSQRPPLNLGLVLDRSGSMSGEKLEQAKKAAVYAVKQLKPHDRVSITTFDDVVTTIVPSTLAANPGSVVKAINRVVCGGSTALHAGWVEGGFQVGQHLNPEGLNRIILLTDGQANAGLTSARGICEHVKGLAARGISTSTLGLGVDYNEHLLEGMANSGDGNYYFVEGASQLPDIFAAELQGLMAVFGHTVSMGLEPEAGTRVKEVYTDLPRNEFDRLQLPNLRAGKTLQVALRLKVPQLATETDVFFVRLAYTDPRSGERHVVREALALAPLSAEQFAALPLDNRPAQEVALQQAARARREAMLEAESGNVSGARQRLVFARDMVRACAAPAAALAETAELDAIDCLLESGDVATASKAARYQSYQRQRSS